MKMETIYSFIVVIVFLYIAFDINYFLRSFFTVLSGRVYQNKCSLKDVCTIYGICTFLDCDLWFRNIRPARLVRELDFARFHFYDRTGIHQRSQQLKIWSLQGCTLIICEDQIPLFAVYKITSGLIYWDDRSLFIEHKVTTLNDGKVRYYLISRQHALAEDGSSTKVLLQGLPGAEKEPVCPENIRYWLQSMQVTSEKLRGFK